jgi:hypothetical protein
VRLETLTGPSSKRLEFSCICKMQYIVINLKSVLRLLPDQQMHDTYIYINILWWCRRMEKISWTDHVRNEEVLLKSQGAEEYPT